jgi:hypothetical protein
VDQSIVATCHIFLGLKLCRWPESTPGPPGRGQGLGKEPPTGMPLVVPCNIYGEIYLNIFICVSLGCNQAGA